MRSFWVGKTYFWNDISLSYSWYILGRDLDLSLKVDIIEFVGQRAAKLLALKVGGLKKKSAPGSTQTSQSGFEFA